MLITLKNKNTELSFVMPYGYSQNDTNATEHFLKNRT